jgi:hypothetical protein
MRAVGVRTATKVGNAAADTRAAKGFAVEDINACKVTNLESVTNPWHRLALLALCAAESTTPLAFAPLCRHLLANAPLSLFTPFVLPASIPKKVLVRVVFHGVFDVALTLAYFGLGVKEMIPGTSDRRYEVLLFLKDALGHGPDEEATMVPVDVFELGGMDVDAWICRRRGRGTMGCIHFDSMAVVTGNV